MGKWLVYALVVIVSTFLILPIIITIFGSFSAYWGSEMFASGVTFAWYTEVFRYYGHTILFTLFISCATVVINILLGTMSAYAFSKYNNRWLSILEEILSLPLAIPGVAIALALIQTHSALRQSGLLILVGHVVFTFPLIFRTVLGALRSKDVKLIDECAATLGAGPMYRFFVVIMPSIKSSILAGSVMVFLLSLGEFNITYFLYTPFTMTLPVGLYDAYASLRIEVGSAFTTVFLILAIPLMFVLYKLNRESNFSRNGGV